MRLDFNLFDKNKIVEILSPVILKVQQRQATFWTRGYFVNIDSRIILTKLGLRINAAIYFKYQRRPSSTLAIVMFRGTPCKYVSQIIKFPKRMEIFENSLF